MGASAVCAADGARLCTVAELAKGCSRGTGCSHDTDLIWSDTPCSSPPQFAKVVIGRSTSHFRALASGTSQCAAVNEPHEVRCCADRPIPGYYNKTGRGRCNLRVFADSSFDAGSGLGCLSNRNYVEASAVCAADGARLCTETEISRDCTAGTGCQHDHDLIWTSTTCWPRGRYVAIGNLDDRNAVARQGSVQCETANDQTNRHEVRCCSDRSKPGYQKRNGCNIWSESSFRSQNNSCVSSAVFSRAAAVCRADGARLCTLTEMMNRCTAGTGCQHDDDLIWTQTRCTSTTLQPYHFVVIGNAASTNAVRTQGEAQCVASNTQHEVRCCSDRALPGYSRGDNAQQRQCGADVWAESNFTRPGFQCMSNQNWAAAEAICQADGSRLCTVRELAKGCSRGTGCGHDADLVWSDTPCNQPPRYALAVIGSSTNNVNSTCDRASGAATLAATAARHEVRCCSDIAIPNYTNRRAMCGRNVWGESDFANSGLGCVHNATYAEASAVCAADGARLCTSAEIAADCTRNTGCQHNADHIWSSTSCSPTPTGAGRRRH
jgi:hypothetical protein